MGWIGWDRLGGRSQLGGSVPASVRAHCSTSCYRGVERKTGHEVDAAFAHVLTIRDGRIVALRQITDTARWTR